MSTRENILFSKVKEAEQALTFTCLEIGASPYGTAERFHVLVDYFPNSRILAFEIDQHVCDELNRSAKPGIEYFPVALGEFEEERPIYLTEHPMCSSLLRPNEALNSLYINLDVAKLRAIEKIKTVSLDTFCNQHRIDHIDFIKVDIQGAELEVFRGGANTLENVLFIVTEVGFVPMYVNQPLFGDVNQFLGEKGLKFHRFLKLEGRTLSPVLLNSDPDYPSQHMWADAIFISEIAAANTLSSQKLLKLGVLAYLYDSLDVAYHCFNIYDTRHATKLSELIFNR